MNKYRIIQYGKKGMFEPQILIKGWFWDSWSGFIDHKKTRFSKEFGCQFYPQIFNTKKEAEILIKNHKKQVKYNNSKDSQIIIHSI